MFSIPVVLNGDRANEMFDPAAEKGHIDACEDRTWTQDGSDHLISAHHWAWTARTD